jgi:uncharacterized membrane protein YedE/YeeE
LGALLVAGGALGLGLSQGWRQGALWLLGAALGVTLFHAAFGFAGAFRRLLAEARGAGLRAQMVMLAVALVLFLPALEAGSVLGEPVRGFVFPVGVGLLVGAFLFGVGMQLGGGCASGTLYAAGGGQGARMWVTLGFFVVGATLAAWQADLWQGWPALAPVSLPADLRHLAGAGAEPGGAGRGLGGLRRGRAAATRAGGEAGLEAGRAAARALAAGLGRGRAGGAELRDAGAGGPALGDHGGLPALGLARGGGAGLGRPCLLDLLG